MGREEATEIGKTVEGKNDLFSAKIFQSIRPGNKADTLIHNTHVQNYPCDFIKIQHEK